MNPESSSALWVVVAAALLVAPVCRADDDPQAHEICTAVILHSTSSQDYSEALDCIERDIHRVPFVAKIAMLHAVSRAPDSRGMQRLTSMLASGSEPALIREFINRTAYLGDKCRADAADPAHSPEYVEFRVLQDAVIRRLFDDNWQIVAAQLPATADVLEDALVWPVMSICGPGMAEAARKLLLDMDLPAAAKREVALRWIESRDSRQIWSADPVLMLLDGEAIGHVRNRLAAAAQEGRIDWSAASVLAQLGDEASIPLLESLRVLPVEHERMRAYVDEMLVWVRSQHPPENLLHLISSVDEGHVAQSTAMARWALQRAVQLGVPKDRVRDALIARSRSIEQEVRFLSSQDKKLAHLGLRELKSIAVDLDVLAMSDLPEIRAYPVEFVP